eukprot:Sdes_comp17634_c0_seq1m6901
MGNLSSRVPRKFPSLSKHEIPSIERPDLLGKSINFTGEGKPSTQKTAFSENENSQRVTLSEKYRNEMDEKDEVFAEKMKSIFVKSVDLKLSNSVQINDETTGDRTAPPSSGKKLPTNRSASRIQEMDSAMIVKGKVAAKTIYEILRNHQKQPNVWTPNYISQKYNLQETQVKNIIEYF